MLTDICLQLRSTIENHSPIRNLDLRGADLSNVDVSNIYADELDLRSADLRKAKLRRGQFGGCRFDDANLEEAVCSSATLRMCIFDGFKGAGAQFDCARIEDSSAIGADLTRASLRGAHLTETSFARAIMREAVLSDAEGEGVEFRGADLSGATLIGARFDEADFRGADLRGADLSRGRFRSADFRGALLEGARFEGADCEGAYFDAGHQPLGETEIQDSKSELKPFDQMAADAVRETLAALPGVFAAQGGVPSVFLNRWQDTLNTLRSAADTTPEEWKAWLEPLLRIAKRDRPLDPKEFLDALCKAPAGLQSMFAGCDNATADELLSSLRRAADSLEGDTEQPPEAWKPWLEPLMKRMGDKQPLDLQALLNALSTTAKPQRPGQSESKSS